MKEFYETYKVYLTRKNLEIAALVVIILSALLVFLSAIPGQGVLTLDKGAIRYDGSLVRGKMKKACPPLRWADFLFLFRQDDLKGWPFSFPIFLPHPLCINRQTLGTS